MSKALIAEALVLTFAFNPVVAVLRSSSTVLILVSKALLPFVLSLVNVCNASISPSAVVRRSSRIFSASSDVFLFAAMSFAFLGMFEI